MILLFCLRCSMASHCSYNKIYFSPCPVSLTSTRPTHLIALLSLLHSVPQTLPLSYGRSDSILEFRRTISSWNPWHLLLIAQLRKVMRISPHISQVRIMFEVGIPQVSWYVVSAFWTLPQFLSSVSVPMSWDQAAWPNGLHLFQHSEGLGHTQASTRVCSWFLCVTDIHELENHSL